MKLENNVISDLNFLMNYLISGQLDEYSTIEKIRWLYIKLGKLLS